MRHSPRACRRVLVRLPVVSVGVACVLALPPGALAAGGSPVHVDPASPVAKEYALPLATARGAPPESGQSGKLFGSGIRQSSTTAAPPTTTPAAPPASTQPAPASTYTAPPATVPQGTRTQAPRPARHRHPAHVTTVRLPALTRPAPHTQVTASATPAAYRVLRPGSGSGLLWMVLAAVVVVALGSAGGLLLSRRR